MRGVIVLAGSKGAGKTSLAQAISKATSATRVSFGDAVRAIAQSKGLPTDTKTLQDLGQSIVERDPALLCRQVLAQASGGHADGLVIDGLRHKQVLDTLKTLIAPRPVLVVFIEIGPVEQARRVAKRDQIDPKDVRRMNLHSVESETPDIRLIADVILDGTQSLSANTARVLAAASSS